MTVTDTAALPRDTEFDRGTAVTGHPDLPGAYRADLDGGWRIGGGINGGLLLATAARALSRELGGDSGHADPYSISAYYLSASRPGPATLRTEVVRRGRSVSTGQVSLSQQGPDGTETERLRALATYGDLDALPGDVRTSAAPPVMPPPEQCIGADQAPPDFLAQADLLHRLDLRLDPACVGWALGAPSGNGLIRGWLRLADGREPDPLMLLLAADALPPVTFDLGLYGWTPTLELTVHVRAKPAPGWLMISHATRNLAGGYLEEDAEVWDSAGRLVAQSRQLAAAPRPQQ
ncbi:thioesterase family protein [Streptacidiphilus sp. ASG 303]|uniref:thioesterase family protein n=1 Tax=Streptacidiphilus sp. ASG 303 TaxID=2896847 RepID=UPI001E42D775|nr:thioesterase family protein [Streptacidiphilus sp. ASG 303]MCD0483267.1 thioesterase family protein [Streptacidiphilus sp. ASG 303]